MSCSNKIVADIVNSCKSVKGIKPLAYWDYRKNLSFTKIDNIISGVWTVKLGSIQAIKFGLNAGFETVNADDNGTGYKHKLSGVLNKYQLEIDELEDIVVFVQSNDGAWLGYGVEQGLWKTSQSKMANDNLATIAIELTSRDGIEEEYSEYVITADLSLNPKISDWGMLNANQIEFILESCINGGAYGRSIDVSGGTNAAFGDWSVAANSFYSELISRDWVITYNA